MTSRRRPPSRTRSRQRTESVIAAGIPLLFCVLAILDFVRDGQVDKYIIGVLLVIFLGASGYRIDTLIEKYIETKSRGSGGNDA